MRAQTTLDFAIGVSVFLLTLVIVFAFVPATLQPFTQTAQEEPVATNRIADLIVMDTVAEPGQPYLLDPACTAALLSDGADDGCGFDGASLTTRLDLPDRHRLNITIQGPTGSGTELLCWDTQDEQVVGRSNSACDGPDDIVFRGGETPPTGGESVESARRIVLIQNATGELEVKIW